MSIGVGEENNALYIVYLSPGIAAVRCTAGVEQIFRLVLAQREPACAESRLQVAVAAPIHEVAGISAFVCRSIHTVCGCRCAPAELIPCVCAVACVIVILVVEETPSTRCIAQVTLGEFHLLRVTDAEHAREQIGKSVPRDVINLAGVDWLTGADKGDWFTIHVQGAGLDVFTTICIYSHSKCCVS